MFLMRAMWLLVIMLIFVISHKLIPIFSTIVAKSSFHGVTFFIRFSKLYQNICSVLTSSHINITGPFPNKLNKTFGIELFIVLRLFKNYFTYLRFLPYLSMLSLQMEVVSFVK